MNSKDIWPLIKYIIAGGIAFVVDFSTLYSLVEFFGFHYLFATAISFVVSLSVNFAISRTFIFHQTAETVKKSYAAFFGVSLFGLVAITLLMAFLVEILNLNYLVARFLIAATLGVGSFFIHKHVTFRVKEWGSSPFMKRFLKRIRTSETSDNNHYE